MTRDTVIVLTPQSRATSEIVAVSRDRLPIAHLSEFTRDRRTDPHREREIPLNWQTLKDITCLEQVVTDRTWLIAWVLNSDDEFRPLTAVTEPEH
jgi:hypothetical protein